MKKSLTSFITLYQAASEKGLILLFASLLALVLANSPFASQYYAVIDFKLYQHFSLLDFINEFLMSIFFLLIVIEIKKELLNGNLSTNDQRLLPVLAAIAGVAAPIIIYVSINYHNEAALRGWAIPAATDIAFALGCIALFGKHLPKSLKVFLTALAIIDDLIAIIIIAIFYTNHISLYFIAGILLISAILYLVNRRNISSIALYYLLGIILWFCFLFSGIHTSIAGVLLAVFIPMNKANKFEKPIAPLVQYLIIPIFALANAGVGLDISFDTLFSSVTIGIIFGLFVGKQLGVFTCMTTLIKHKVVKAPASSSYLDMYGVAILCGIGFTMSLFIATLSFADNQIMLNQAKIGIIVGSLLSAVIGAIVLKIR